LKIELCQGTTSVVPQMANSDFGFSRCGIANYRKKAAVAKAQHDFAALPAPLKSCPDAFCSLNGILQKAQRARSMSAVPCTGLRVNDWFRQPCAEARG
jgi:hypothetical protein